MSSPTREWMKTVEERLDEGRAQFDALASKIDHNTTVTAEIKTQLDVNTVKTTDIDTKLDAHITHYNDFTQRVSPALDAIMTMQSGVRVLGKIGGAVAWLARWLRKTVVWLTPLGAAAIAIWHFFYGGKQ